MQLKDMEEVASVASEGFLWCNGEPQAALKMCAVNLVDFRKTHGLNAQIIAEENPPAEVPGESSSRDGDQETLHARLKMISIRLVDYGKAQSRKATAEAEAKDEGDVISSNKAGDQRTLHGQLRMSSVRLVDCRKSQKRKAESDPDDEAYDAESKNDGFICPSKSSRFDGDQQTLEAQLKVCLVKLVDCGERQSRNAAADGESSPDDGEDENSSLVQTSGRKSPRKVKFVQSSNASRLSDRHIVLCKGQMVYQCSQCSRTFSSSLDFETHQHVHREEKRYHCTLCGKRFAQRSQLRRHQSVHAGGKKHGSLRIMSPE